MLHRQSDLPQMFLLDKAGSHSHEGWETSGGHFHIHFYGPKVVRKVMVLFPLTTVGTQGHQVEQVRPVLEISLFIHSFSPHAPRLTNTGVLQEMAYEGSQCLSSTEPPVAKVCHIPNRGRYTSSTFRAKRLQIYPPDSKSNSDHKPGNNNKLPCRS
jgi:hypothetical protein